MDDRSFLASVYPKTCSASAPCRFRSAVHTSCRWFPNTSLARKASASSRLLMAKRQAVSLEPRPNICGKIYHIQCDRLLPCFISERAVSKLFLCAVSNRAIFIAIFIIPILLLFCSKIQDKTDLCNQPTINLIHNTERNDNGCQQVYSFQRKIFLPHLSNGVFYFITFLFKIHHSLLKSQYHLSSYLFFKNLFIISFRTVLILCSSDSLVAETIRFSPLILLGYEFPFNVVLMS